MRPLHAAYPKLPGARSKLAHELQIVSRQLRSMPVHLHDLPDELLTDILHLALDQPKSHTLLIAINLRIWCGLAYVCRR